MLSNSDVTEINFLAVLSASVDTSPNLDKSENLGHTCVVSLGRLKSELLLKLGLLLVEELGEDIQPPLYVAAVLHNLVSHLQEPI